MRLFHVVPMASLIGGCALLFPISEDGGVTADAAGDISEDVGNDVIDASFDVGLDTAKANLLKDPGFELAGPGCSGAWSNSGSATLTLSTTVSFSGKQACQVCGPSGASVEQTVDLLTDGGAFTLTAEIEGVGTDAATKANLVARYFFVEGGSMYSPAHTLAVDAGWVSFQSVFPVNGVISSVMVLVETAGSSGGCILVDDVSLL